MGNEVRLSQDWSSGRTQCINSLSLLTNVWAEGRKQAKIIREKLPGKEGVGLTALVPSTALPEVRGSEHSKLSASSGKDRLRNSGSLCSIQGLARR